MRDGRRSQPPLGCTLRSPVARALVLSRLLVLAAGVAGAGVTRRDMWPAFDATQLSSSMGTVGNLLGAAAVRWDAIHYLNIASHGYTPANTVFYPLYPLLMRVVGDGHRRPPARRRAGLSVRVCSGALAAGPGDRRRTRAAGGACRGCPPGLRTTRVLLHRRIHRVALPRLVARLLSCRPARSLGVGARGSVPSPSLTRVTGCAARPPTRADGLGAAARILAADPWARGHPRRAAGLLRLPWSCTGWTPLVRSEGEAAFGRVSAGPLGTVVFALRARPAGGLWLLTTGPESIYWPSHSRAALHRRREHRALARHVRRAMDDSRGMAPPVPPLRSRTQSPRWQCACGALRRGSRSCPSIVIS